jgi:hypothetical protein
MIIIYIGCSHTVKWKLLLTIPYVLHVTNTAYGPCKVPSTQCRIDPRVSLVYSVNKKKEVSKNDGL